MGIIESQGGSKSPTNRLCIAGRKFLTLQFMQNDHHRVSDVVRKGEVWSEKEFTSSSTELSYVLLDGLNKMLRKKGWVWVGSGRKLTHRR